MSTSYLDKYNPLREIRSNARYDTYEGNLNETPVFIKQAKQQKLAKNILDEAIGLKNMYELDTTKSLYHVPQMIEVGEGFLVATWESGYLMIKDFQAENPNLNKHLKTLLDLFLYIDRATTGTVLPNRYVPATGEDGVERVLTKLRKLRFEEHIDMSILVSLGEFIKPNLSKLETRFTHGDLQPGNILVDTEKAIPTIIDCESCSWLWPRHYNIINFMYNYMIGHTPWLTQQFQQMLDQYLTQLNIKKTDVVPVLNTIAGLRCLQSVYENLSGLEENPDVVKPLDQDFITPSLAAANRIMNNQLFLEEKI